MINPNFTDPIKPEAELETATQNRSGCFKK